MYGLRHFGFLVMAAVAVLVLGFSASGEAAVYKWQDDQGKTHFTDSPGKIPPQYRDQVKSKGWPEESRLAEPKPAGELKGNEGSAADQSGSDEKKMGPPSGTGKSPEELAAELEKQKKKLEAELKATEAAIAFFEVEVPRYDDYYERFPGRGAYRGLKGLMPETVKGKKEVAEILTPYKSAIAKSVIAYITESLVGDEWFNGRRAQSKSNSMTLVKTVVVHLKKDLPKKKSMLAGLQADQSRLEAEIEKVKAELKAIEDKQ